MATSVSYWQAYFHAHAQVHAYEEKHGLLSDDEFKLLYNQYLQELLRPTL